MLKHIFDDLRETQGEETEGLPPASPSAAEMLQGDEGFLRGRSRSEPVGGPPLRWVDLFAGCGAMSLGVWEAACADKRRAEVALAVDFAEAAVAVFRDNFEHADARCDDITKLLTGCERGEISPEEEALKAAVGRVDLLIGGPPCQGHSDLNNFSRRDDPRNRLYPYMARAAEVFDPKAVIIENVKGVPHDRTGVLAYTSAYLEELGYHLSDGLIDVSHFGVAQKRVRHVLLATKQPVPGLERLLAPYAMAPRSIRWAIGDLTGVPPMTLIDRTSTPSKDNARRMSYLFENDLFDLPDSERPPCHRDKAHTYRSVYGRMRWEDLAQTVTSGFYSMCMGRYVHPERISTLTAHEAARLQFIPDSFSFGSVTTRTALAEMIGNAVPPKLTYILVRALLKQGAI
ncbi:DNA cytosine methyltransferase [Erythrobacter sp. R86502]|uniref:DNA cytosine methyltransferase n=1 Tax=Erythrobacter sp. R86502 TaxID=3093846 RepID=UPI0036D29F19